MIKADVTTLAMLTATAMLHQGFSFEMATLFFWLSCLNKLKLRNQSSRNVLTLSLTAEVLGFGAEASTLILSSFCSNGAVSDSDNYSFHLLNMRLKTEYIPFTPHAIRETVHTKNENESQYARYFPRNDNT